MRCVALVSNLFKNILQLSQQQNLSISHWPTFRWPQISSVLRLWRTNPDLVLTLCPASCTPVSFYKSWQLSVSVLHIRVKVSSKHLMLLPALPLLPNQRHHKIAEYLNAILYPLKWTSNAVISGEQLMLRQTGSWAPHWNKLCFLCNISLMNCTFLLAGNVFFNIASQHFFQGLKVIFFSGPSVKEVGNSSIYICCWFKCLLLFS